MRGSELRLPTTRSYQDLFNFVPGVQGRTDTQYGGSGTGDPSVRGEGQVGNNFLIDGISARDVATSLLIKQESRAGRLPDTPVMLLLDREADEFLATTSDADAWVTKPLNSLGLRRAAQNLLDS